MMQVPVMLSRCGLVTGRCDKVCAVVEVEEDTHCECSCLPGIRENCSELHTFNSQTCSCDCRASHQYKVCRF